MVYLLPECIATNDQRSNSLLKAWLWHQRCDKLNHRSHILNLTEIFIFFYDLLPEIKYIRQSLQKTDTNTAPGTRSVYCLFIHDKRIKLQIAMYINQLGNIAAKVSAICLSNGRHLGYLYGAMLD